MALENSRIKNLRPLNTSSLNTDRTVFQFNNWSTLVASIRTSTYTFDIHFITMVRKNVKEKYLEIVRTCPLGGFSGGSRGSTRRPQRQGNNKPTTFILCLSCYFDTTIWLTKWKQKPFLFVWNEVVQQGNKPLSTLIKMQSSREFVEKNYY